MAKDYAKGFYNSTAWQLAKQVAMQRAMGLCEICGRPAKIVHHTIQITPGNITNPDITLNLDNLQALCQECHNRIHQQAPSIRNGLTFDASGQLIAIRSPLQKGRGPRE